jgi:O-antigen/teichoic acid export membrane protein
LNLLKTSFLAFIATAIKIIAGLVINKAVSVYIGPSGIALIGQFQSGSQIATTIAQGGINTGVTKYTAEYGQNSIELPKLWSTAAQIVLTCSLVVGLILVFGAFYLSDYLLKTDEYGYIFIVFGFSMVFFTLNQLLLSILNGLKEIKTFITINIAQSVYALIFTTLLVFLFGLDGALIALVTNQSVIFALLLWRLRKHNVISIEAFKNKFDTGHGKKLFSYSAMALTTACTMPVSLLLIRNYIGENLSWNDAGYWQSMWYISSMYLMVVTTALSTYYLPRLSEIVCKKELRCELRNGYLIIIPIVILLSASIYFLRDFIVLLLFTDDFSPMVELFKWQLIGDILKVASWLSGFLLIAKASIKLTVFSEILFAISFFVLSLYFLDKYGLVGMTYAYALNYFFHLLFMLYFTNKTILY